MKIQYAIGKRDKNESWYDWHLLNEEYNEETWTDGETLESATEWLKSERESDDSYDYRLVSREVSDPVVLDA